MPDAPVLELRSVEVRYGSVPAVRDLSLALDRGEIVGLIGPNGAGKTTTLHSIMRSVPLAGGEILLRGEHLRGKPEDVARAGIALVPEGRHIFGGLTVEENLRLGLSARRSREGVAADLDWVHGLFPIVQEFARRKAGLLSGGQQQQLAIARALVARPDVLLLDEPSLGLAPTTVDSLFETLGQVRDHGVTILLVEQRGLLAVSFADRTHVLSNAELRLTLTSADAGTPDELAARLTQAYLS
ncbi:MAG TPA: ABC transporter ATP-binding protein [Gaiellaceae bacterium]|jgi:branched-chain amino acid transport system ATP-binding protein|nr:ABC transporter ATP-binding protein [Gaiellaceae bacterium]